jgi:hypothetical protein
MGSRPGNGNDIEQARAALLQLHLSLMQDYKTYVLTLAIGSVGLAELWRIACPIFFLSYLWFAGAGFIVACVFFCITRFAYIGKLVVYSLYAVPSDNPSFAGTSLIFRLDRGILEKALDYRAHGIARAWKLLAQLGSLSGEYLTLNAVLCAILLGIVSLSLWHLLSGYHCLCIS